MDKHQILKQYFGHKTFREGQEQLIDSLLSGRDALGIMPTGGGKSMCYQVPALMLPGVTLVVSPLISLMKDQVMALKHAGIPAAYINSSLTPAQLSTVYQRLRAGPTNSSMSPRSGLRQTASSPPLRVWTSPCWRWTRPTASPSGGRISGPATARSRTFWQSSRAVP